MTNHSTTNFTASVEMLGLPPKGCLPKLPPYKVVGNALHHIPLLAWILHELEPSKIIHLGLGDGVSYFTSCHIINHGKQNTKCVVATTLEGVRSVAKMEEFNSQYEDFSKLQIAEASPDIDPITADPIDVLYINFKARDRPHKLNDWADVVSTNTLVILEYDLNDAESPAPSEVERLLSLESRRIELEHGFVLFLPKSTPNTTLFSVLNSSGTHLPDSLQDILARIGDAYYYGVSAILLEDQIIKSKARIMEMESDLGKIDEYKTALNKKDNRLSNAEARVYKLRRADKESAQVREQQRLKISDLEQDVAKYAQESHANLEALCKLRIEKEKMSAIHAEEISAMVALLDERSNRVNKLKQQYKSMEGRIQHLEEKNKSLEANRSRLEADYGLLESERNSMQEQRDELIKSTSWRITKPFRSIVLAFRRLK